jgi:methylmalonyl-CoA/ethylmalonyl-CoA epimerase
VGAQAIHHIGVAVRDLDEATDTYEQVLGARLERRETLAGQGVEAVSVLVGTGRVELLASLGEDTPVAKFIAKRGPGMHHVAYEVEDLAGELATLTASGVELIDSQPRQGLYGLQVAFVHPDAVHGVLTELVSRG